MGKDVKEKVFEYLLKHRVLSASFLIRRFKVSRKIAREILRDLEFECDDVLMGNEDVIYLQGIKYIEDEDILQSPKKSRWKDVTKP